MKSSPVTVTKFVKGVAQTPTVHAASKGGYILCVNDSCGSRLARRSTSLVVIAAFWFDLGGEGGNARVYRADGSPLSATELAAAREQLGEMA